MGRVVDRRPVVRIVVDAGGVRTSRRPDSLAGEEPLELRVGHAGSRRTAEEGATKGGRAPLAVTMRTPGDDIDLAIGFLYTEGIIRRGRGRGDGAAVRGDRRAEHVQRG